jgi:hyperosmotically inducible periplasmic protein
MRVRFSALLCLTGLAACSHQTNQPSVKDPSYVEPAQAAATEPAQPPALERTTTPAPSVTPSTDPRPTAATAPLVADTKGTKPNDFKANDDARMNREATRPDVAPDNTKVNERDRSTTALTPLDQSNDKTDLKITQQIRQAVMADGSLSFTAKNVKIITQAGKVTLRGPVNSEQERSNIEAAARKVAGVAQVDNQLEVKK